MNNWLVIVLAYLFGSIPFGVLVGKITGVNIRQVGSGNIGATNMLRTVGKLPAIFVLIGDALKGTFSVFIAKYLEMGELWVAAAGLAAIIGHLASIYLGLKGGKGVATGFGVFVAINPQVGIVSMLIWLSIAWLIRYSSLAAVVTFLFLPIVIMALAPSLIMTCLALVVTTLIVLKHMDNIARIIAGTETRIGKKMELQSIPA